MRFLIINGPNLNMLGVREKNIYGNKTYEDLKNYILDICKEENIEAEIFQSNHEGFIVDKIQSALNKFDGIIINPAAYTHTSVAILDALKAVNIKTIEVHLSDIQTREEFRKHSFISLYALKTFKGEGFISYEKAIKYLKNDINKSS